MEQTKQYYHLLVDFDGTTRSSLQSTGIVITDEQAAKDWVASEKVGYFRGYETIYISEETNGNKISGLILHKFRLSNVGRRS